MVEHGLDPKQALLRWPSFAEIAASFGAIEVTVRTAAELERALGLIGDTHGPLLIDVRADPAL